MIADREDRRRLLIPSSSKGEGEGDNESRRGKPVLVGGRRKTRNVVEASEERARRARRETVERGVLGGGEIRERR